MGDPNAAGGLRLMPLYAMGSRFRRKVLNFSKSAGIGTRSLICKCFRRAKSVAVGSAAQNRVGSCGKRGAV
jgi:hypothetical protein